MTVSVIVPTLNEEEAIAKVLQDVPLDIVDEIIVVDSSSDATGKIAENHGAKVVFEHRKGYGRALQSGVDKATGAVVVYIDGDWTYSPRDIRRVVEPISSGEYDVVLGDRLNGKMHPEAMNCLNKFGNLAISLILSLLFRKRVRDTQCGLRAVRKRFIRGLSYEDYGMPYVTEQLIKLIKQRAKIGNVTVTYRPRIGATKLCAWIDGFRILKVILKERIGSRCL